MKPWLVFDRASADAAREHADAVEPSSESVSDTVKKAAVEGRTTVIVVPAGGDRTTVARITPPERNRGE